MVGLCMPLPLFKWTFCKFDVIRSRFNVFGVDVKGLSEDAVVTAVIGFATDVGG